MNLLSSLQTPQATTGLLKKCAILCLLFLGASAASLAQGECQVSYVSHHIVSNQTSDTLAVWVDHKNQDSFPTDGPWLIEILPYSDVEVSDLEWAETFKNPMAWFVFAWQGDATTVDLNVAESWAFEPIDETNGLYRFVLE